MKKAGLSDRVADMTVGLEEDAESECKEGAEEGAVAVAANKFAGRVGTAATAGGMVVAANNTAAMIVAAEAVY